MAQPVTTRSMTKKHDNHGTQNSVGNQASITNSKHQCKEPPVDRRSARIKAKPTARVTKMPDPSLQFAHFIQANNNVTKPLKASQLNIPLPQQKHDSVNTSNDNNPQIDVPLPFDYVQIAKGEKVPVFSRDPEMDNTACTKSFTLHADLPEVH